MALKTKTKKKKILKKVKKIVKNKPKKVTRTLKKPLLRKALKKASQKKPAPAKAQAKKAKETVLGEITHYFPHVRAAVVKVKVPFAVGDTIKIKGHTTDFKQIVTSMQIDRTVILKAKKNDEIGLLVDSRVRSKDIVTKA